MKNKIIIIGILIIAVIAVILNIQKNDTKELTFGVITGISGEYAHVGESFVNGVKLAQEEWNYANPQNNINIIIEDDAFEPKKGLSAYQKLVNINKVDGLVNMTTFTIDVIAEDVKKRNLPVAQGFIQTDIEDDTIVQVWPSAELAERKLGEHVRDQEYKDLILVVSNNSSVFRSFADDFKIGYQLPLTEIVIGSEMSEIRTAALKIKEADPDGVVFIVLGNDGGFLIQEIEKLYGNQDKPQYIFDANLQTTINTAYTEILKDLNILNGSIVYTVPLNYTEDFNSRYRERFGVEPSVGSETGYNAFKLLAMSYDSNQNKWIENMKTASFMGADGLVQFDETGTRIPELKIGRIENGQLPQ